MNVIETSHRYYALLDELLTKYDAQRMKSLESPALIGYLAKKVSWYFSRMLLLQDNDLRNYEGLDFVEILYFCGNLYDLNERPVNWKPKDVARFKELLLKLKEYAATRSQLVHRNVIDSILVYREHICALAAAHGVAKLMLFGSVLNRTEKPGSNIDFIAVFDDLSTYEWDAIFDVQEELEAFINRKVTVIDWYRIPEPYKPSDPVDIMQLEADKQYNIIPKTSLLYYVMLGHYIKFHDPEKVESLLKLENRSDLYRYLAKRISWWFSRLLLLSDNDLRDFEGFSFIEVLYLCDKLEDRYKQSPDDIARFKELFPKVRDYVFDRCPSENEELTQFARAWVGNRGFDPFEEME